jgi:hypothetical protein
MQYGPAFQRLTEISADTLETRAVGSLTRDLNGDENKYHLHPTVVDAALQMGLVAARSGKLDAKYCAAMPTLIEEVTIFKSAPEMEMFVTASTKVRPGSGEIHGHFQVISMAKLYWTCQRLHSHPSNKVMRMLCTNSQSARELIGSLTLTLWMPLLSSNPNSTAKGGCHY